MAQVQGVLGSHFAYCQTLCATEQNTNMKTIQLKNIELEVFESAFSNFKKFVSSDFEFDYQKLF
jgi:hypothetical protein